MVILKAKRPGQRRQRFKDIDYLIFNTRMNEFDVHPRRANRAVYSHILTVNKLAFQRSQLFTSILDMFKHRFKTAHHKLSLRVDLAQFVHHRKNVLLQRHLIVTIRQQNLFCHRRFFQHLKIAVKPFAQPVLILG